MKAVVLAALSARMMVEAAARDGYLPLALDLFGDLDTRARAHWESIGKPGDMRIDATRLLAALERLARRSDVLGWVAGSGFEAQPQLLEAGARLLPLLGTPAAAVRRVRDPWTFFGALDALGVPHPQVRWQAPHEPSGWLYKRSDSAGGWHIRRAEDGQFEGDAAAHGYFQRQAPGMPMSALFVGNGWRAQVLGFNELIVRPIGAHPYVYCGAIGPVPVAPAIASVVRGLLDAFVGEFGLKGLGSLDFMLDGTRLSVLELNPRPSASMALYGPRGVMRSHLLACLQSLLPAQCAPSPAPLAVQGNENLFAAGALQVSAEAAAWLASQRDVHDLPSSGTVFASGDPMCSVSAQGRDADEVRELLSQRRQAVLDVLESVDDRTAAALAC